MPHSVAPLNAAVCNKSKAAFRQPTVRNNNRTRKLTGDITGTVERNVRNLQDAISIISEIRAKLKVLADFYSDSDSGDSGN
jgi:hypothetical protein